MLNKKGAIFLTSLGVNVKQIDNTVKKRPVFIMGKSINRDFPAVCIGDFFPGENSIYTGYKLVRLVNFDDLDLVSLDYNKLINLELKKLSAGKIQMDAPHFLIHEKDLKERAK